MIPCITPFVFSVLVSRIQPAIWTNLRLLVLTNGVVLHETIDLFGGVDILGIEIDVKENSLRISREFGTGLIVMASLSFLLTLLQMVENDLGNIDRIVSPR